MAVWEVCCGLGQDYLPKAVLILHVTGRWQSLWEVEPRGRKLGHLTCALARMQGLLLFLPTLSSVVTSGATVGSKHQASQGS